jgi:hypothetical protein
VAVRSLGDVRVSIELEPTPNVSVSCSQYHTIGLLIPWNASVMTHLCNQKYSLEVKICLDGDASQKTYKIVLILFETIMRHKVTACHNGPLRCHHLSQLPEAAGCYNNVPKPTLNTVIDACEAKNHDNVMRQYPSRPAVNERKPLRRCRS